MGRIDERLQELQIELPPAMDVSALPFDLARIHGDRVYLSGHVPVGADGRIQGPLGQVGSDVSLEEAQASARQVALGLMRSLQNAIGDLDRVTAWLRVFGMVNAAPGFVQLPPVINGASDVIIDVFGAEVGAHTRSAVGMHTLPFNIPVEIEAEVAIR